MKRDWLSCSRRQRGSVLAMAAAALLALLLLLMLLWGTAWRVQQRQRALAALREGTRTAMQQWSYAAFADGEVALRDPALTATQARTVVAANLAAVPGLAAAPKAVAGQATWTQLDAGMRCGEVLVSAPSICGLLRVPVRSLPLGFAGVQELNLSTVMTLDLAQH